MDNNKAITKEVLNLIMPIVANEIKTQCLSGINWALVSNRRSAVQASYKEIREKLTRLGFKPNEAMRVYSLSNGVIYDLDSVVVKRLIEYLTSGTPEYEREKSKIDIAYEQRKTAEMFRLAESVTEHMRKKEDEFIVALFNMAPNTELRFNGKDADGVMHQYKLEAFALRHWDLQECNRDFIMPRGYQITKMEIMEIIPSEKGVSYKLHVDRI